MGDFVFQLAVVFFPGLICNWIVEHLCSEPPAPRSDLQVILRVFGFGSGSYVLLYVIQWSAYSFGAEFGAWFMTSGGPPSVGDLASLPLQDVLFASLLSAPLGADPKTYSAC